MLASPPILLALSVFRDAPPSEVADLLERAATEPQEEALSALSALLMNRTLRLLRQGSRQEILEESLMLNRFLAIDAGDRLRRARLDVSSRWAALGELLSGAARSTSRAAVPSILKSTRGRGQEILELLAGEGRPVPRSEVKRRLGLAESHLSHLLRDLEGANLVVRYRPEGGKEVLVALGPAGEEVVDESVLPPWIERLAEALAAVSRGVRIDGEELARSLHDSGAPSRLAAGRLAEALGKLSLPSEAPATGYAAAEDTDSPASEAGQRREAARRTTERVKETNPHFANVLTFQRERRPGALFSAPEPDAGPRSAGADGR